MLRSGLYLFLSAGFLLASAFRGDTRSIPKIEDLFGDTPTKLTEYEVIVEPDKDAAEWWAGAPSVVRDRNGTFWLARRGDVPLLRHWGHAPDRAHLSFPQH